jgi:hypothetical protein
MPDEITATTLSAALQNPTLADHHAVWAGLSEQSPAHLQTLIGTGVTLAKMIRAMPAEIHSRFLLHLDPEHLRGLVRDANTLADLLFLLSQPPAPPRFIPLFHVLGAAHLYAILETAGAFYTLLSRLTPKIPLLEALCADPVNIKPRLKTGPYSEIWVTDIVCELDLASKIYFLTQILDLDPKKRIALLKTLDLKSLTPQQCETMIQTFEGLMDLVDFLPPQERYVFITTQLSATHLKSIVQTDGQLLALLDLLDVKAQEHPQIWLQAILTSIPLRTLPGLIQWIGYFFRTDSLQPIQTSQIQDIFDVLITSMPPEITAAALEHELIQLDIPLASKSKLLQYLAEQRLYITHRPAQAQAHEQQSNPQKLAIARQVLQDYLGVGWLMHLFKWFLSFFNGTRDARQYVQKTIKGIEQDQFPTPLALIQDLQHSPYSTVLKQYIHAIAKLNHLPVIQRPDAHAVLTGPPSHPNARLPLLRAYSAGPDAPTTGIPADLASTFLESPLPTHPTPSAIAASIR